METNIDIRPWWFRNDADRQEWAEYKKTLSPEQLRNLYGYIALRWDNRLTADMKQRYPDHKIT